MALVILLLLFSALMSGSGWGVLIFSVLLFLWLVGTAEHINTRQ